MAQPFSLAQLCDGGVVQAFALLHCTALHMLYFLIELSPILHLYNTPHRKGELEPNKFQLLDNMEKEGQTSRSVPIACIQNIKQTPEPFSLGQLWGIKYVLDVL
eukprot:scaffold128771_cov22-Prasinocladus_malaysianus.AAC.1